MKLIENAGHWPHQEMPDEFNRVLLKFLVGKQLYRNMHDKIPPIDENRCILM